MCSRKIEDGGMNITMHGNDIAMFRNGGYVVNGIIKPFRQLKTNTFLSFKQNLSRKKNLIKKELYLNILIINIFGIIMDFQICQEKQMNRLKL